jgi:hypothetical protein
VNTGDFAADLEVGLQSIQDMNDVEDLALKYQELTQNVTEQHAPMRTINLKGTDVKAWYDDEIHEARKERRRRERKYRKTELEVHKLYLAEQAEKVVQLVKAKKRHFYHDKFLQCRCQRIVSSDQQLAPRSTEAQPACKQNRRGAL